MAILRLGIASLSRDTEKRDVFSINFRLAFNVARSEFSNTAPKAVSTVVQYQDFWVTHAWEA